MSRGYTSIPLEIYESSYHRPEIVRFHWGLQLLGCPWRALKGKIGESQKMEKKWIWADPGITENWK